MLLYNSSKAIASYGIAVKTLHTHWQTPMTPSVFVFCALSKKKDADNTVGKKWNTKHSIRNIRSLIRVYRQFYCLINAYI